MEQTEHKDVELRSEELQEIMGKIPSWILRRGINVLFLVVVVLLTGSHFFKYPDVIEAPVVLTGSTPPADIVALSSGKLDMLNTADRQKVKTGDYLAVINNPARTEDVLYLKRFLDRFDPGQDSAPAMPEKNLQLGDLQPSYLSFYVTLFNCGEYMRLQYYPNKMKMTEERIARYVEQYRSLLRQQEITEEQSALTDKNHERSSTMHEKGGISGKELDESRSRQLQGQLTRENMLAAINDMRIQISQMRESLMDMEYQHAEKINGFRSQIRSAVSQIRTEIHAWEMNYVLISPIDGTVTFTRYWTGNQNVHAGDAVFTVIPSSESRIFGRASLPVARSGKVKTGQHVNVRLDNFPDSEFGMLRGTVDNISLVPTASGESVYYTVEIGLPDGLRTNYGKTLPHRPSMQGRADIITDNISLLERFIMPLRKIFSEGYD
ncbi:MAG: HlyD family secretion protein [Dysgonamonadaceae bacterium]|jgi:HlyD family secretion protein|nr:HlyD family secretion protein [Dysgonamonadaceae bacterium]